MKKLLLIALLIVGCAREYECDLKYRHVGTGEMSSSQMCEGEQSCINYTVDWPKGKKEADEQCEDAFRGQVSADKNGEYIGSFHSCTCEKAD